MQRLLAPLTLALVLTGGFAACSSSSTTPTVTDAGAVDTGVATNSCVLGSSTNCVGSQGCNGTMKCNADGSGYDGCICNVVPDAGHPTTDSGSTTDAGDSGPSDAAATCDGDASCHDI